MTAIIIHHTHCLQQVMTPSALPLCGGSTILGISHLLSWYYLFSFFLIRGLFGFTARTFFFSQAGKRVSCLVLLFGLFFLRGIFYQIFSCGASKRPWKVHPEGSGITPHFYSFESTAFYWLSSLSAPILPLLTAFLLWWLWLAVLLGHIWRHSIHIGTMVWNF
jgi:hypothetical protein